MREDGVREIVSVQDRDLLGRLSMYFHNVEARIREGQGWLIFNADRQRTGRIARFIGDRLREYRPLVSSYNLPWRDFALNAYMLKVELAPGRQIQQIDEMPGRLLHEYTIAGRVSRDMYYSMRSCDLLILTGVAPDHPHEVAHLDEVVDGRLLQKRPTIIISPKMPHQLEEAFRALWPHGAATADPSRFDPTRPDPWQRFFGRLYDANLIAL